MPQEDDFSPGKQPPDGVTLPLNLKKLVIYQLRQLATVL